MTGSTGTAPGGAQPQDEIALDLELDNPSFTAASVPAETVTWTRTGGKADAAGWLGSARETERGALLLAAKYLSPGGRALRVTFPGQGSLYLGWLLEQRAYACAAAAGPGRAAV